MESYKCRFCSKSFFNGRALGGHMRSHMPNLHKFSLEEERQIQVSNETESDVSSSSSEDENREKKKQRIGDGDGDDRKFGFTGESESESSRNITRKRSKRTRKLDSLVTMKMKASQLGYKNESDHEPPQSSAASDTTTEEDLAFCLMMLSRDKWKKKMNRTGKEIEEEFETEESEGFKKQSKEGKGGRYKCETCGKVFKSYQALGGHRASHKKNRVCNKTEYGNVVVAEETEKRVHECPICLKVFASGQALGGHKRSHGIVNHHHHHQVRRMESVQRMIDLNLPPSPMEEDEVSVLFQ